MEEEFSRYDIAEARTTGNEQECDEIDWTVKSK